MLSEKEREVRQANLNNFNQESFKGFVWFAIGPELSLVKSLPLHPSLFLHKSLLAWSDFGNIPLSFFFFRMPAVF